MPKWDVLWQRSVSAPAAIDAARRAVALIATGGPTERTFRIRLAQRGAHLVDVIVADEKGQDVEGDALLQDILHAATTHGEQSEAEHEVGDLQMVLTLIWEMLTRDQRRVIYQRVAEGGGIMSEWMERSQ